MSNEAITLTWYALESGILSPTEGLLLLRLADFADESWSCFPSQDLLEVQTNQKERAVRGHLSRLRELNLVRTEDRRNAAGHRTGLRFYLNRVLLEEIKAGVQANRSAVAEERRLARKLVSDRKRGLATANENAGITLSAHNAGRGENAGITLPAHNAGRDSLPAESCKNPESAFKRIARGYNPQQQPTGSAVGGETRPVVPGQDPAGLLVGWDVVDDLKLVHRGVDVLGLAASALDFDARHTIAVWHRVIDLVLDRASGIVKSPNAYVISAFSRSARALMIEAAQSLDASPQASRPAFEAPAIVECDMHSWSGREGAQCPSCRADALVGEPSAETSVAALTEEQIQKLPEQYRHMVSPGFKAPQSFENTRLFQETPRPVTDHDSVAPWDREDLVRS